jgi:hypothetical protein
MKQLFQAIKSRAAVDVYGGMPVYESTLVPRDQIVVVQGHSITMHPITALMMRHGGKLPLWSRYSLGERELQRDRRLR